jgi:hypothetical protein
MDYYLRRWSNFHLAALFLPLWLLQLAACLCWFFILGDNQLRLITLYAKFQHFLIPHRRAVEKKFRRSLFLVPKWAIDVQIKSKSFFPWNEKEVSRGQ